MNFPTWIVFCTFSSRKESQHKARWTINFLMLKTVREKRVTNFCHSFIVSILLDVAEVILRLGKITTWALTFKTSSCEKKFWRTELAPFAQLLERLRQLTTREGALQSIKACFFYSSVIFWCYFALKKLLYKLSTWGPSLHQKVPRKKFHFHCHSRDMKLPKDEHLVFGAVLAHVNGQNIRRYDESKWETKLRVVSNPGRDSGRFKPRKKYDNPRPRQD